MIKKGDKFKLIAINDKGAKFKGWDTDNDGVIDAQVLKMEVLQ